MKEPTTTFKQQQMHFKGLISKQFQNIFVEYNKKKQRNRQQNICITLDYRTNLQGIVNVLTVAKREMF